MNVDRLGQPDTQPFNILDVDVNWCINHRQQNDPQSVNLITWLTSDQYYDRQREIIACTDQEAKARLKASMPVIMPSLHMGEHTGLIALDIDGKDNPDKSIATIRETLQEIEQVAYCGQSVSGNGLWAIIPIADPLKHLYHFLALERIFKNMGIYIDAACKNVNRLRYYAYDPHGYFNPSATVFQQTLEQQAYERRYPNHSNASEIDVISILERHGWRQVGRRGDRLDFCRPGKNEGISGNVRLTDNVFYCFTSSTEFEPGRGYAPISVLAIIEHGGNFEKAIKSLKRQAQ